MALDDCGVMRGMFRRRRALDNLVQSHRVFIVPSAVLHHGGLEQGSVDGSPPVVPQADKMLVQPGVMFVMEVVGPQQRGHALQHFGLYQDRPDHVVLGVEVMRRARVEDSHFSRQALVLLVVAGLGAGLLLACRLPFSPAPVRLNQ